MTKLNLICGLVIAIGLPILAVADVNKKNDIPVTKQSYISFWTGGISAINNQTIYATPTPAAVLVQQKTGTTASGDLTITMDSALTVSNMLIVCISLLDPDDISSVQISSGDGLEQVIATNGTGIRSRTWARALSASGTQIVIHPGTGLTRVTANASEWHGATASGSAEGNTGVANATVTAAASNISASTGNLIIATAGWTANDYSSGPTNGFTRMTAVGGGSVWQETAYYVSPDGADINTGWTLTAGINWAASISNFTP